MINLLKDILPEYFIQNYKLNSILNNTCVYFRHIDETWQKLAENTGYNFNAINKNIQLTFDTQMNTINLFGLHN